MAEYMPSKRSISVVKNVVEMASQVRRMLCPIVALIGFCLARPLGLRDAGQCIVIKLNIYNININDIILCSRKTRNIQRPGSADLCA